MKSRGAVVMVVMMLICGRAAAQNDRLGDIAGSITLNRDAVTEKSGFAEDPGAAVHADSVILAEALDECQARADHLEGRLAELRKTVLTRDAALIQAVEGAVSDLSEAAREIGLLRLSDELRRPLSVAREAADACDEAASAVQSEVDRERAAGQNASRDLARCRELLERARAELTAPRSAADAGASTDESRAPARVGELANEELISDLCRSDGAPDDAAVSACLDRQFSASAALSSRTADNEMLDPLTFAEIRNVCATEHPRDFAARNLCEVDRMTAARVESE